MAFTIDPADPCAAANALRDVYYKLIAGQAAMIVSFKGGPTGVERSVTYHKADSAALVAELRRFEDLCAATTGGKPKRFAVRAGGRHYG